MRRKLLTLAVIVSALSLGACTDNTMDELILDTEELNQTSDTDPDDDGGKPPGGG